MNFEEFKNTYFDGNEDRALAHLAYESYNNDYVLTGSKSALEEIVHPLEGRLSNKFMILFRIVIKMNPGIMTQNYAPVLDAIGGTDSSWKYDEEFIKKGNPFGKEIKKYLLISLIGVAILLFVALLMGMAGIKESLMKYVGYAFVIFGTYIAFPLYRSIDNYFEFKKTEKNLKNSKKELTLDEHLDEVLEIAYKKKKFRK